MEKGWIKIRTYTNAIEAEMVKQMLEENGYAAIVFNKQDSSYLFGKIELFIREENASAVKELLVDTTETGEEDVN